MKSHNFFGNFQIYLAIWCYLVYIYFGSCSLISIFGISLGPAKKRPDDRRQIQFRRTAVNKQRNARAKFFRHGSGFVADQAGLGVDGNLFRCICADAIVLNDAQRPEIKRTLIASHGVNIPEAICVQRGDFIFASNQRPDMPAVHAVAVTDGAERIKIIVRHDILFSRLTVNRKHHRKNFVARQSVFNRAVKWEDGGVVQIGISRRALVKINREKRVPFFRGIVRFLPAGKAEELEKLPPPFLTVLHPRQQRIQNIIISVFDGRIADMRIKWRERESVFILGLLRIIKRPGDFSAATLFQREIEMVENKSKTISVTVRFSGITLLAKTREQKNKSQPQ